MKSKVLIETLRSCIAIVKQEVQANAPLGELGIIPSQIEKLSQDRVWTAKDRVQVVNTIRALVDGFAVQQGFIPFQAPAEFVAAMIYAYVNPVNYRAACSWFAGHLRPAVEESVGVTGGNEPVTDRQLFALLCSVESEGSGFGAHLTNKVEKSQNKVQTTKV